MRNETDPRKLEGYLEQRAAYDGGLEPEVQQLLDSLEQWPRQAALQPRPGFLNELAGQLQEQAAPPARRLTGALLEGLGRLLRGAGGAAVALVVLVLFGLWLVSLSGHTDQPTAAGPESSTQPVAPFVQGSLREEVVEQIDGPGLRAITVTPLSLVLDVIAYFALWLLVIGVLLLLLALLRRRTRPARLVALAGFLPLLLVAVSYPFSNVSWRIVPAVLWGYHYDPSVTAPDERLVPRRPEVLIERQLAALVGQTGADPLRADNALADYTIDRVHIVNWDGWPTARVDATLTFADGATRQVNLTLPARGGGVLAFPLVGEVTASAYAWYAPESSLGRFFETPAPATPVQDENAPLRLELEAVVETMDVLARVEPESSFVAPSHISAGGDLLADVDLREDGRNVGYAILLHTAGGESHTLAAAELSGRAVFSPDGRRIAYVRGFNEHDLALVVREAGGGERRIPAVDWMNHHWVGNGQIAFSHDGIAYLYDLGDGSRRPLARLVPSDFTASSYFRVSPDGARIAYVDFEGRLWVEEIGSGRREQIGWDVSEVGWGSGIAWRPDGEQLVFTTVNDVTLPDQAELWLWEAPGGAPTLLARTGAGFLNTGNNGVRLGKACWADEETVLFAADLPSSGGIRLLAADVDGGGLWDVTPPGAAIPFPEMECGNGYIALNHSRTAVAVYAISSPASSGRRTITGRIVEGYGLRRPVGGATLQLEPDGEVVTLTQKDGHFTLNNVPFEETTVYAAHMQFVIPAGEEVRLDLGTLEYPLVHPPALPLADYPPRDTPYLIEGGDFWLAHTPDGELFAFVPISPEYRDMVEVEECRYDWNEAVGRFVDPCSGDEWELDGRLNLDHSTALWSRRDLDRYATTVEEGVIRVYLDRVMRGTPREE